MISENLKVGTSLIYVGPSSPVLRQNETLKFIRYAITTDTVEVANHAGHTLYLNPRHLAHPNQAAEVFERQVPPIPPMPGLPESFEPTKLSNPKDAAGDSKVPLWLLSPIAKAKWALAQFAGMVKYGAWNWRVAGVRASTYSSAIQRHHDGWLSGEEFDPDDGTDHLANIMACCSLLIEAKAAGKLTDDRPPRVTHRAAYAEVQAQMAVLRKKYADKMPKHYTIEDVL